MTHPGIPGSPEAPGPPPPVSLGTSGPRAVQPAPGAERTAAVHEFAGFYRSHFTRLVAYLVYQGAAAHLAADIAQDTMATVYRRWSEISSPRAYAWTVAYRAFIRQALDDSPETPVGEVPEPASVLPSPGKPRHGCSRSRSPRYCGRCPTASARSSRSRSTAGHPPR